MKKITHITPRYFFSRVNTWYYYKLHPDEPWLTQDAIKILDNLLSKNDVGIDFGSGRSTLWFAERLKKLYSIEGNKGWYDKVNHLITKSGFNNIEYQYIKNENASPEYSSDYLKVYEKEASFDFVLVDGIYRYEPADMAIDKLQSGGLLVIDNCNWFLASNSNSPTSVPSTAEQDKEWSSFNTKTEQWRRIWTSNGVTDTLILIKP